jgi:ADP-ribose pyrophosphatase YjhB (NUDIX family)
MTLPAIDFDRYQAGKIFSFCPRCGVAWRFKEPNFFSCDACGFSYYHGVSAAVSGILLDKSNNVVLVRRAFDPQKGLLDLVGGFLSYGETAEDGLRREIKEELNLEPGSLDYLGCFPNEYFYRGLLYHTLDVTFTATVTGLSGVSPGDDAAECAIRKLDRALLPEIAFESSRNALRVLIDRQ